MTEINFGSFQTSGVGQTSGGNSEVDYEAMNEYRVKAANLERMKNKTGTVVGIVDLGQQQQPDAKFQFTGVDRDGTPITEEQYMAENSQVYFEDGFLNGSKNKVRLICYPQKPIQSVAIAIDFPDIILDIGQFYGKSDPKPLRIYMGGQYFNKEIGKMVIGRPTPLREKKYDDGQWGFSPNHIFNKMARECMPEPLISDDEKFKASDILQLIGKSFSFQARVYFNEYKGKKYFTQYIKYQGMLSDGVEVKPLPSNIHPFYIGFKKENTEQSVSELPYHVANTITLASDFSGSQLEEDFKSFRNYTADASKPVESKPSEKKAEVTPVKGKNKEEAPNFDDFDDDIPF